MAGARITGLTVDYLREPIGIAQEDLRFAWRMESSAVGSAQTSWRVEVRERATDTVVWDSGRMEGSCSVGIPYDGAKLKSAAEYTWHVTAWDQDGEELEPAESTFVTSDVLEDVSWVYAEPPYAGAPLFRREFELADKPVASALLSATAMGIYELRINGARVGDGTVFAPGWTDYRSYVNYQTYDVTDQLRSGEANALAVAVGGGWYEGGFMTDYSDVFGPDDASKERGACLRLRIRYADGTEQLVETDEGWRITTESPYRSESLFDGEAFDARIARSLVGWDEPGFDDAAWAPAPTCGYAGRLRPSARAAVRRVPAYDCAATAAFIYRDEETRPGAGTGEGLFYGEVVRHEADLRAPIALAAGEHLIVDFGQNMVGHTEMLVEGTSGTTVTLRFAEMLNDGRKPAADSEDGSDGPAGTLFRIALRTAECTDRYVMAGTGIERYEQTFTYRGFRYAEVTADAPVVLHGIRGLALSSVAVRTGHVETSDNLVNRLFLNSVWGELGNYLSVPTDCPQRDERAGWSGDAQLFCRTALMNFDSVAFLKNYVDVMDDYLRSFGTYGPIMPDSDFRGWKCAGWGDAGIIIPWTLWQQTGDVAFIDRSFDAMDAYMDSDNSGAVAHPMGFGLETDEATGYSATLFGDWLAFSGASNRCINMLFRAYTARLMEQMAAATGRAAAQEKYVALFARTREEFINKYLDDDHNLLSASADDGGPIDMKFSFYPVTDNAQAALIWALKLGMYRNEDERDAMVANLVANIHNADESVRPGQPQDTLSVGFLGVNVILPVLTELGLWDLAYTLLLQDAAPSWLFAVKNGATTTWERWDSYSVEGGFKASGMNSFNHYAYGSVSEWMYQYMAGVATDEERPGYAHVLLQPCPDPAGRITSAKASYDSVLGTVAASWESEGGKLVRYVATVPANATATLYLPKAQCALDLHALPVSMRVAGEAEHCGVACLAYELAAGTYELQA